MKLYEVMKVLEEIAPFSYALNWDNVGLLVGDKERDIRKIYIALDCDDFAVDEAIRADANLVLTHHPLIFSGIKRVTADDFIGRRIMRIVRHKMAVVAMHTNFDLAHMARLTGERMELCDVKPMSIEVSEGDEDYGLGVIGDIFNTSLGDLAKKVKEAFELGSVKYFGDKHMEISRVAIVPGSGKSEIDEAISQGADVLITGDVDHHSGIDAVAKGLAIIDAGHYGIEHIFIEFMKNELEKRLADADIEIIAQGKHEPFKVI